MDTLRIRTLDHLALRLCLDLRFLQDVAHNLSDHYTPFNKQIGSKERRLFKAHNRLRLILVQIKMLLRELYMPENIIGGRPGGTIRKFARVHVNKPLLLELDIRNFYPSTAPRRVCQLFHDELECSPEVADLLTRLTTAEDQLPQGFNTSCDIGNLIIRRCVKRLAGLARQHDFDFTVWVDNFVLSGPGHLRQLEKSAVSIMEESGFEVRKKLLPHWRPQTICGATVNSTVSFSKRKRIEADIQAIVEGQTCTVCNGNAEAFRRGIEARIGATKGLFNSRQGRKLKYRYRTHALPHLDRDCRCDKGQGR